nr:hypothetical protein [Tanacetum cinerariifolium]
MSPGNVAGDKIVVFPVKCRRAESTAGPSRVHNRAVAAETQPKMSADVARSYDGDDGGKGKRKPNLGGNVAGRLNTRDKTRNLSLKEITDKKGPVPIQFELRDKPTVMPLGDHAAHWSSYIEEVIRGVSLYYPSWLKVPKERKAALITNIGVSYLFTFISLSCSFI